MCAFLGRLTLGTTGVTGYYIKLPYIKHYPEQVEATTREFIATTVVRIALDADEDKVRQCFPGTASSHKSLYTSSKRA